MTCKHTGCNAPEGECSGACMTHETDEQLAEKSLEEAWKSWLPDSIDMHRTIPANFTGGYRLGFAAGASSASVKNGGSLLTVYQGGKVRWPLDYTTPHQRSEGRGGMSAIDLPDLQHTLRQIKPADNDSRDYLLIALEMVAKAAVDGPRPDRCDLCRYAQIERRQMQRVIECGHNTGCPWGLDL